MTPTDHTRPADGPGPDSGHTETHDAREGLRMAVVAALVDRVRERLGHDDRWSNIVTYQSTTGLTIAEALPDLLAEAWDEGYIRGFDDRARLNQTLRDGATPNPYRTEGTNHA